MSSHELRIHNQFCRDDWDMYRGAGPRGMGPAGDGCVCSLTPPGYREITKDSLVQDVVDAQLFAPRLWDKRPDSVTHIAGGQLNIHGRYLRQRCDWCGVILVEYDLTRVAVPVGQEWLPAMWSTGSLVRVDGYMSAEAETFEESAGVWKLPMDSCTFDPETQVK